VITVTLPTRNRRFKPASLTSAICAALLTAGLIAGTGVTRADEQPEWLEAAQAQCAKDYGDARCEDESFLQQQYSPEAIAATRAIALKAGTRRHQQQQRALREVMLMHTGLCDQKPEQYCPPNNLVACAEQLNQACTAIKQQAASCRAQTNAYCAQTSNSSQCLESMKNQCGSVKKQSVEQILAKYPTLTPIQKAQIKQTAEQLEANTNTSLFGRLASNLLGLLGF
jgi:hypothetical protein